MVKESNTQSPETGSRESVVSFRNGIIFSSRDCRACDGGERHDECEHCDDGWFQAELMDDWSHRKLKQTESLVAYLDIDRWSFIGIENLSTGESEELDFPFKGSWADGEDFELLGFVLKS